MIKNTDILNIRSMRDRGKTIREISEIMGISKTTVLVYTGRKMIPKSGDLLNLPPSLIIYDCQLLSDRVSVADYSLELFNDDAFMIKMLSITDNYIKGFPDFIITDYTGSILYAIEKKSGTDQLSYNQGLWLDWFRTKGVMSLVWFDDGFAQICNIKNRIPIKKCERKILLNRGVCILDKSIICENVTCKTCKFLSDNITPNKIKNIIKCKHTDLVECTGECFILPPISINNQMDDPKQSFSTQRDMAKKLRAEGFSYRQIAEKMGLAPSTVFRYCGGRA